MTRTVLVVVAIFVVCQMPYHAMEILNLRKTEEIMNGKKPDVQGADFMAFLYVNALSQILVFISACCNPILYGILNENYSEYKPYITLLFPTYTVFIHVYNIFSLIMHHCQQNHLRKLWIVTFISSIIYN